MAATNYKHAVLTASENKAMQVARIAFMDATPFFANVMISIGEEIITRDIPTAATDGKRIMINPDFFFALKVPEQVFVLAHEMWHLVSFHAQRFKHYLMAGSLKGKPAVHGMMNMCADFVINADLVNTKVGKINPEWLYDPKIKAEELWEDVYDRLMVPTPPPPPGTPCKDGDQPGTNSGSGGQPGVKPRSTPKVARDSATTAAERQAKGDKFAKANGGSFDQVLEPARDPLTGKEDLPEENEFKEAIARAAAVAKAAGKLPGSVARIVKELLDHKVDWREHIRLLVTGNIGDADETWNRPNRRRLALNPQIVLPTRIGYGCERVVVGVDTSGSISERELQAFMAEVGGILADCQPREIVVIGCDAVVETVETVTTLDEVRALNTRGLKGGGGTYFHPVFDHVEEHQLWPETLIYLTDGYPSYWPTEKPAYPVVWAITSDQEAPFGSVVRLKVDE